MGKFICYPSRALFKLENDYNSYMPKHTIPVKPKITYGEVLGKIIEYHRKELGRTQAPFADALGLGQSGYSRIEKGQTAVSVVQLQTIAGLLDRKPADLLNDADRFAELLRERGTDVVADRKEETKAGLLIALGILIALLAAS